MPRETERQLGGASAARPGLQMAALGPAGDAPARPAPEPVRPREPEPAPPAGRRIVAPLSLRARTR